MQWSGVWMHTALVRQIGSQYVYYKPMEALCGEYFVACTLSSWLQRSMYAVRSNTAFLIAGIHLAPSSSSGDSQGLRSWDYRWYAMILMDDLTARLVYEYIERLYPLPVLSPHNTRWLKQVMPFHWWLIDILSSVHVVLANILAAGDLSISSSDL